MTRNKKTGTEVLEPDGFTITYWQGLPSPKHLADVWYAGDGCIATVSKAGFSVDVECQGDMKYVIDDEMSTGTDLFIDSGITNDEELHKANEEGRIYWDMNPWFNLYLEDENFEYAEGDIPSIVERAKEYINEQTASEEIINGGALTLSE